MKKRDLTRPIAAAQIAAAMPLFALAFSTAPAPAAAAETITYSYDAKGRVVKAERSGTVNNAVKAVYTHDKANNRRTVKVTGSANNAPP